MTPRSVSCPRRDPQRASGIPPQPLHHLDDGRVAGGVREHSADHRPDALGDRAELDGQGLGRAPRSCCMLIIPAFAPAVISAYSVVGERDQGTLEPLLTHPDPPHRTAARQGRGRAPSDARGHLCPPSDLLHHRACRRDRSAVVSAVFRAPLVLAEVLYAPLLAGWGVWIGIAISVQIQRRPDRPAAEHVHQPPGHRADHPDLVPGDPPDRAHSHRVRRRPAADRCWRVANRRQDVRPRASRQRTAHQAEDCHD